MVLLKQFARISKTPLRTIFLTRRVHALNGAVFDRLEFLVISPSYHPSRYVLFYINTSLVVAFVYSVRDFLFAALRNERIKVSLDRRI